MTQKKIRLAYVIDGIANDMAGTERQLLETLKRLDRQRFEPVLICLTQTEWQKTHTIPCETVVLEYKGFLKASFPSVLGRFRAVLRDKHIDIIQTFFEDALFVSFLATRGLSPKPVLLSSRRDIGLGKGRPWYHALYNKVRPYVLRRFNGVIANGRRVKDFVVKNDGVPDHKVQIIYNGVDLPNGTNNQPAFFQQNHADLWIAMAANFNPVKRHDVLLDALALLKAASPDCKFKALLMGQGQNEPALRQRVERLGLQNEVHFLGAVKRVGDYLPTADIGVLCSDREGLSNAVLEYMAYGLPVVATAVGSTPEVVDASNGFCVPAGAPERVAEALKELALKPELRREKGRQSLKKIQENFSWDHTMHTLENYYQTVNKG